MGCRVNARGVAANGPCPPAIETLLAALGSCLAGTFAVQATARGIAVHDLELDLEAVIDFNGFFGLKPIRPRLSDVKLNVRVKSDADPPALREILEAARSLLPVFDTVTKPVGVEAEVSKA